MTDLLALNPFHRLTLLLQDQKPGDTPLPLHIGDPRTPMPDFVQQALTAAKAGWSDYPQFRGSPEFAKAATAWLTRRFKLPAGFLDPSQHLIPVSGSREGLFFSVMAAVAAAKARGIDRPAVLLPDPGYFVYGATTVALGAEPIFVPVTEASGHLPDYTQLAPAILARTAIALVCSPANPQGAGLSLPQIQGLLALARHQGFVLGVDECYSELFHHSPPAGGLEGAAASGSLANLLVFHSLSKRSGAPGLRCGFVAGEAGLITALEGLLRIGGAGVPSPILAAGEALYGDEHHVEWNRSYYRGLMDIAERCLGNAFGWRQPDGGFFVWLDVSQSRAKDGETAALWLWQKAGIRVLPGAYLSLSGATGTANPGNNFIRIAMVFDPATTEAALTRVAEILL